jgi:hypothetical protein
LGGLVISFAPTRRLLTHFSVPSCIPLNRNYCAFVGLFQLDHYAPDPRIRASLEEYLERAWSKARDPDTGLFTQGGIGIQDRTTGYGSLDQSAFVIMYSLLAWPRGQLLDVY